MPDPAASLSAPPGYTPVGGPPSAAQFAQDIAKVKTIDWSPFSWTSSSPLTAQAGTAGAAEGAATGVASQLPSGQIALNADNVPPKPGYSVLGVPHAQTLYHATILASKTISGTQYNATCYFEIFTGTPQATRTIKYGVAWQCNQPWIQGSIAAGLGGINNPDGSVVVHALGDTPAVSVYDANWYADRVYYTEQTYNRTFENQLEDIYGYLDLNVDGATGVNDHFFGQPGGGGAIASYNCSGVNQTHVLCEIVTDPFTFVPSDDTHCTSGTCNSLTSLEDAYESTMENSADSADDLVPVEPGPPGSEGTDDNGGATTDERSTPDGGELYSFDTGTQTNPNGSDSATFAYSAAVCGNEDRCQTQCYLRGTGMEYRNAAGRRWDSWMWINWCGSTNDPAYSHGVITRHSLTCHRSEAAGWSSAYHTGSDRVISPSTGQARCTAYFGTDPIATDGDAVPGQGESKIGINYSAAGGSRRAVFSFTQIPAG